MGRAACEGTAAEFHATVFTYESAMRPVCPALDPTFSSLDRASIRSVPVLRLYGWLPNGTKACVHVHQSFPSFLILIPDSLLPAAPTCKTMESLRVFVYSTLERACIEHGLRSFNATHIFEVEFVEGTPFYGFHATPRVFVRVYMFHSDATRRLADLVRKGELASFTAIPFEIHIPHFLKFCAEHGVNPLEGLSATRLFARGHRSRAELVRAFGKAGGAGPFRTALLDSPIARETTLSVEVDVIASDISNALAPTGREWLVPSVATLLMKLKREKRVVEQALEPDAMPQTPRRTAEEAPILATPISEQLTPISQQARDSATPCALAQRPGSHRAAGAWPDAGPNPKISPMAECTAGSATEGMLLSALLTNTTAAFDRSLDDGDPATRDPRVVAAAQTPPRTPERLRDDDFFPGLPSNFSSNQFSRGQFDGETSSVDSTTCEVSDVLPDERTPSPVAPSRPRSFEKVFDLLAPPPTAPQQGVTFSERGARDQRQGVPLTENPAPLTVLGLEILQAHEPERPAACGYVACVWWNLHEPEKPPARAVFAVLPSDVSSQSALVTPQMCQALRAPRQYSPERAARQFIRAAVGPGVQLFVERGWEGFFVKSFSRFLRQVDPEVIVSKSSQTGIGALHRIAGALGLSLGALAGRPLTKRLARRRFRWKRGEPEAPYAFDTLGRAIPGRSILFLDRIIKYGRKMHSPLRYTVPDYLACELGVRFPTLQLSGLSAELFERAPLPHSLRLDPLTHLLAFVEQYPALLRETRFFEKKVEMSKVYGLDFLAAVIRGSQYRVESLLLRVCKRAGFVLPSPSAVDVQGMEPVEARALIMEPLAGFYDDPIAVLDFSSLYPSVIIAYNLCYSTLVCNFAQTETLSVGACDIPADPVDLSGLNPVRDMRVTRNGSLFVKRCVREGVLPRMLEEVLHARRKVQKMMGHPLLADAAGSAYTTLLNSRQLAIKLLANVIFGYTSATNSGRMPLFEIGDAIVDTARKTLEDAIELVHTAHPRFQVIYTATDSLFIRMPGLTHAEAHDMAVRIAAEVTKSNPPPIHLKVEGVLCPAFLVCKNHYGGLLYEARDQEVPKLHMKGIEPVRKDTCQFARAAISETLETLMRTADSLAARAVFEGHIERLRSQQVPFRDFIGVSRSYLGHYRGGESLPAHARIALEQAALMKLSPARQPAVIEDPIALGRIGRYIPAVVVNRQPGSTLRDSTLFPTDALASFARDSAAAALPTLNLNHYVRKKLVPPLTRVAGLRGIDVAAWVKGGSVTPRLGGSCVTHEGQAYVGSAQRRVFRVGAQRIVFRPSRHRTRRAGAAPPSMFTQLRCGACGTSVAQEPKRLLLLCERCEQQQTQTVAIFQARRAFHTRRMAHLDRICRACGGADLSRFQCTSFDCPALDMRERALRDLEECDLSLEAFYAQSFEGA